MSANIGLTPSSVTRHIVRLRRQWYSGMKETALCGARVDVLDHAAGTAAGAIQPAGTCKTCAAALGQTVRKL